MDALSTIVGVAGLVEYANNLNRRWTGPHASRDPRVIRWNSLACSHDFDAFTLCGCLGFTDVSPAVATDAGLLASSLDSVRLRAAAEHRARMAARDGWPAVRHAVARPLVLPLLRELIEWKRSGEGHVLLAFKSRACELDEHSRQSGAIVLMRCIDDSSEHPLYTYRPVYTLQSWHEPAQRWRAFRMVWAT